MSTTYDQIGSGYSTTREADRRIVDRVVSGLDLLPEQRILDVGAGTGSYSRPLADRGFEMTALEPSVVMRDSLRRDTKVGRIRNGLVFLVSRAH